jgi:hypothetical protein
MAAVDLVRRERIGRPKFFNLSLDDCQAQQHQEPQETRWRDALQHRRLLHQCGAVSVCAEPKESWLDQHRYLRHQVIDSGAFIPSVLQT